MQANTKQMGKLLYLHRFLHDNSDENHPVSMHRILAEMEQQGVSFSRRTVREGINALIEFGVDVHSSRGRNAGYFIGEREFEIPEVKLLMDCVSASRFLTGKKTADLQQKLTRFVSNSEAKSLERQVHVQNRVKNMNESIYYNVDKLHIAINQDKAISFLYFDYNREKLKVFRRDGKRYKVSPYALLYDNEKYYLVAYDSEALMIKHFRVDKMFDIRVEKSSREGRKVFMTMDIDAYTERVFSMYGGNEDLVTLLCDNSMANVIIDRFGIDTSLIRYDEEHFIAHVKVIVSRQFYGWLFGLDGLVTILRPKAVAEGMSQQLNAVKLAFDSTPTS